MKFLLVYFIIPVLYAFQFPFFFPRPLSSTRSCGQPGDVFEYKSFDIEPGTFAFLNALTFLDPPAKGAKLIIRVTGYVHETIVQGSTGHAKAKLGFIGLFDKTMDLCEQLKNVNKECPIPEGPFELIHQVDIPQQAPSVHHVLYLLIFRENTMCLQMQLQLIQSILHVLKQNLECRFFQDSMGCMYSFVV